MDLLKKIPQRQVKRFLILITLLIIAASYFFGYQKFSKKTDLLIDENRTLTSERNELQQKNNNKENIIRETEEMKEKIEYLLNQFPSTLTQDKTIMFIHNLAEHAGMTIKMIGLSENELFYPLSGPDGSSDTDQLLGFKTKVTISYESTYEGLKNCIDYIHSYKDRANIPSFNASFDHATGNLSGTMSIDFYALAGIDREVKEETIDGVRIGTDNIFGTFENLTDNEPIQ